MNIIVFSIETIFQHFPTIFIIKLYAKPKPKPWLFGRCRQIEIVWTLWMENFLHEREKQLNFTKENSNNNNKLLSKIKRTKAKKKQPKRTIKGKEIQTIYSNILYAISYS